MSFIHDDFMLQSETAKHLYHDFTILVCESKEGMWNYSLHFYELCEISLYLARIFL